MDFELSEELKSFYKDVLHFASTQIGNNIHKNDELATFSRQDWQKCAQFGLLALPFPQEYGGVEASMIELAIALEAMGEGCADRGLIFSLCAHLLACCIPVWKFSQEAQKRKWLPRLIDGSIIAANAITEPEAGSDVFSLNTTAEKIKDGYVINGSKIFATNVPEADLLICYAKTAPLGYLGISAFAIPADTPGIIMGSNFHKIGLRTSPLGTVYFENCQIPKECRLGREGNGGRIFETSMAWERTFLFAFYVGLLRKQLQLCCEHASNRKQWKKPLVTYQAISHKLAEMKLRLEVAHLLLYKAVNSMESQNSTHILDSCLAKLYITEASVQSALDAIQIHGAFGSITEGNIERMLRDAVPSTIFSGTNEMMKEMIDRELL